MAPAAPVINPTEEEEISGQDIHEPLWNAVLLDDDDHTYEYVIEMLVKLLFKTPDEAMRHAMEVDATGRTIVLTAEKDAAEFAAQQIKGYGADWRLARSKGSMSAIVEPAA